MSWSSCSKKLNYSAGEGFEDESSDSSEDFLSISVESGTLKVLLEVEDLDYSPYIYLGYDQTKNLIDCLTRSLDLLYRP